MCTIIKIAYDKLSAALTDESLKYFVQWLDREYCKDDNLTGLPQQLITRSIIALGSYLVENKDANTILLENISKTIKAANEFLTSPNEDTFEEYFNCASNSYPFGVGEGCYSIRELIIDDSDSCGIGTGCVSGAGSLMLNNVGERIAFQIISEKLTSWIREEYAFLFNKEDCLFQTKE